MDTFASVAAELLGERIRDQREARALSQEDVAHMAAMHVLHFGKIERGLSNPSLHTLLRIASVLEIDPGVLIAGHSHDSCCVMAQRELGRGSTSARGVVGRSRAGVEVGPRPFHVRV